MPSTDFAGIRNAFGVFAAAYLCVSLLALVWRPARMWFSAIEAYFAFLFVALDIVYAGGIYYAAFWTLTFENNPYIRFLFIRQILRGPFFYDYWAFAILSPVPQVLWVRRVREQPLASAIVAAVSLIPFAIDYWPVFWFWYRGGTK